MCSNIKHSTNEYTARKQIILLNVFNDEINILEDEEGSQLTQLKKKEEVSSNSPANCR